MVDVSVVMPCLNEESSVGLCVREAIEGMQRHGLRGEVVVCDNNSDDNSVDVARRAGARVVVQKERGYGIAYRTGFAAARGKYIVMGDSDLTYDFSEVYRFVGMLEDGYDYVLGSRRNGTILPGAMPALHRYLGNPVLTWILNLLFGLRSSDAHSGMRAFTRSAIERMNLRCDGMEFASEIVIAGARSQLKIAEVPITYRARIGESKLRSWRDGWRHLRFMLLLAPKFLFILPGLAALVIGMAFQAALLPHPLNVGLHSLDMHFSALFAMCAICGYQVLVFGIFATEYTKGIRPGAADKRILNFLGRHFSLERGIVIGLALVVIGAGIDAWVLARWIGTNLGPLNEMRPALFSMTLIVLGVQTIFASFFLSLIDDRMAVRAGRELDLSLPVLEPLERTP
ncbi:MAG: glycosyltransferase family 2 protein [Mycobacteriales bacterium]